ncbi:MAG: riboflavin synthase [Candidatus Nezhaarchaeota archaeon]|nr:riboflavin synthase [Candidatus Nezhaarchaeota archaeon]MCX8141594.1 riboflavin synthase [Candidatus Nezhaarchaeota archaeon]MDW8049861.1 riboflavin synthase [Nitrososphaerota archaeon]
MPHVIGVVDTTFARVDMAKQAIDVILSNIPSAEIVRYTVPGIKDIPVAVKKVLEKAEIAITFGWVGPKPVDKYSYLAASIGLILTQLMTGKHVIDVTVHEDEAESEEELYRIAVDRARKHALNLVTLLIKGGEGLTRHAGQGLRQGMPDVGPIIEG